MQQVMIDMEFYGGTARCGPMSFRTYNLNIAWKVADRQMRIYVGSVEYDGARHFLNSPGEMIAELEEGDRFPPIVSSEEGRYLSVASTKR